MPAVIDLPWDASALGLRAGRVASHERVPEQDVLRAYDHVHVRIPLLAVDTIAVFEEAGFRFITVDFELGKRIALCQSNSYDGFQIEIIAKRRAPYLIEGFTIEGSRLWLDPRVRAHLPAGFWDQMLIDHCTEFADFVICAVDAKKRLLGAISCFIRNTALEMFLVAVHPSAQGRGIGSALLKAGEERAVALGKEVITNVVAGNMRGMNFYLSRNYRFRGGAAVLHWSGTKS